MKTLIDGIAIVMFEAVVKSATVHGALDAAEAQAEIYAENRGKICSFTKYEITNAEPTGIDDLKIWTIVFS